VPRDRTSVLVIRAWATAQESGKVRARIIRVPDVARREPIDMVANSEEDVVAAVRAWMRALGSDGER